MRRTHTGEPACLGLDHALEIIATEGTLLLQMQPNAINLVVDQ